MFEDIEEAKNELRIISSKNIGVYITESLFNILTTINQL